MALKLRESLDTNIVLRLILKDILEQCMRIQDLLMRTNVTYEVTDLAITETVYVLQDYKLSRKKIVDGIRDLLQFPGLVYNQELFDKVFPMYLEHPKLSFNDCYLAVKAEMGDAKPLWTFDRALAKQSDVAKLL